MNDLDDDRNELIFGYLIIAFLIMTILFSPSIQLPQLINCPKKISSSTRFYNSHRFYLLQFICAIA